MNTHRHPKTRLGRGLAGALALAMATSMAACDFSVSNPGPVEDSFLDNATAHQAMANGAMVQLADALANVAYTTGAVTREIFPAGSTGSFGITGLQQTGVIRFDDTHSNSWTSHQRARKMATDAVARFEENPNVTIQGYRPAVDAAIWAGYAYRLLGDAFCEAVIDGGSIQPRSVFYDGAEEWFTRAIQLAGTGFPDITTAAHAGRASVRAQVGDWTGAMSDAAEVPDDFVFNMPYTTQESSQMNRIYYAGANQPYRAHTVWNTFYEDYYLETQDPRTPWEEDPENPRGDAALAILAGVTADSRATWYPQMKHDRGDSPHELSSGWEMRLLEAENLLRQGDFGATTMELINRHRVELGLDAWDASTLEEAWTVYKRERGIELWLNARRMPDLARWQANNSPGELHPRETPGHPDSYLVANQSLCYPVPRVEYERNPNLTLP